MTYHYLAIKSSFMTFHSVYHPAPWQHVLPEKDCILGMIAVRFYYLLLHGVESRPKLRVR